MVGGEGGETGLSPGWRLWVLATFPGVDVCQITAAVSIQHSGTGTCEKVIKGLGPDRGRLEVV